MVAYPQAPELSTGCQQVAKNRLQRIPQEISPLPIDEITIVHISPTPYYD